jgi:pyruvate kinase
VITATQMLESMIERPRPTRAEASDVANAIFDGTDAVMLSAETAMGKYPVEAVRIMSRIVTQADQAPRSPAAERATDRASTFPDVISEAAWRAARELRARAIVAFTQSGSTARLLAKYRPEVPILAFSPSEQIRQRLSLCWGVVPKTIRPIQHTDELVEEIEAALLEEKAVYPNDALVIVAGAPMWVRGTTNLMKLHRVGEKR